MAENNVPGLGLALADGSGVLWTKGFGWADRAKRIPFTADTRSNVGSVSKLFTCAAILKLAEEGKLELDQPLGTYLPEFSIQTHGWPASGITIRSMLTHHSGLPSDRLKEFISGDQRPADYPDAFLRLPAELAGEYTAEEPGAVFSYSNLAFSLLGSVVARVSGRSFSDQLQESVLEPLGMKDSSFLMTEQERQTMARGYRGKRAEKVPYLRDLPAGSLVSTANDMGRFVSAVLASAAGRSELLQPSTVREMWSQQNHGVPRDFDFGVGLTWWLVSLPDLPGVPMIGHGGDLDSFHALLAIDPEHQIGVFLMVNGVEGVGSFTLADVAAQALRGLILARGGATPPPAREVTAVAPVPSELLLRAPGYYATPNGLARIKAEDGKLKVHTFGHWLDAVYHVDGSFGLEARLLGRKIPVPVLEEIGFTLESAGGEDYLNLRTHGLLLAPCQKVTPAPAPESWLRRAGRYRILNPDPHGWLSDVSLKLDESSGFYVLKAKVAGAAAVYPLHQFTNQEARLMGYGRNLGQTLRFVPGPAGEKLHLLGYELSRR
jgi:CubicO group peptidase (beta-lactamase class C family)